MTIRRRANQVAGAAFVVLIVWYVVALGLDIRGVRKMCSQITPGSSIDATRAIINRFGFSGRTDQVASPGVMTSGGNYTWYVPSHLTMGDFVCEISHDGTKVLTVSMSQP